MNDAPLIIQPVKHGSPQYRQTLALRQIVLRTPLGLEFTAEDLASEAKDFHYAAFQQDGPNMRLVGCFILRPVEGNPEVLKLRQVAVSPNLRGYGYGRRMMIAMEAFAQEKGAKKIEMHARESVLGFYEALGYAASGEIFEEVTIPHRYMSKMLG